MKWKLQEDHKGFTLIELLVSVTILAFVVAPFLASFVAAGESNIKSKRKQEATDLGQLLAEEFMVKDFEKLKLDYSFIEENVSAVPEDGKKYTFKVSNSKIPESYRGVGYRAEVSLEPAKDVTVNKDTITPQINSAESGNMAVVMSKFFEDDPDADAVESAQHIDLYRHSTITLERSEEHGTYGDYYVYTVTVKIDYRNGSTVCHDNDRELKLTYDKLPSIYLLYLPYDEQNNDVIIINNQIPSDAMGGEKLDVYIAQQVLPVVPGEDTKELNADKIWVTGIDPVNISLQNIIDGTSPVPVEQLTTKVHSNISGNLVPLVNVKSLYNMKIDIYIGDKKVATLESTKNITD